MMETRKKVHLIAAARPNFMKIAPLFHALKKEAWAAPFIVHTGQHYDINMSDAFFTDLNLPSPHFHLGVGSGTHAEQTGHVMIAYEKVIMEEQPHLIVVAGDVNSTVAVTLAAVKLGVPVAHLEAGLRSFDRTMPEEINRIVTDSIADYLWTPSPDGDENLLKEGVDRQRIIRVGNIMIDSLEMMRESIEHQNTFQRYGLKQKNYGLVTLHRPSNVDRPDVLKELCQILSRLSDTLPLIFPVHPRTRKNLVQNHLLNILENSKNIVLTEPLNYINFMNLVFNCRMVITDSGGVQEETTYLGIPCITMRRNTERPVTVTQGTNELCSIEYLEKMSREILSHKTGKHSVPELWDGRTSERVVESIKRIFDIP
jgi:UDP-N-acetylglucosamine 2-epimerase (non-hydrolysing)